MMTFYVAGSYANRDKIKLLTDEINEREFYGFLWRNIHDWWNEEKNMGPNPGKEEFARAARSDMEAVLDADAVMIMVGD